MDFSLLLSSMLDDPLPWMLAALTILIPAIGFLSFLWFFRATRLVFLKDISCPEEKRRATVELIAQVGESAPYRDVRACSLRKGEKAMTCRKGCLTSSAVLEAPFIIVRKLRAAL